MDTTGTLGGRKTSCNVPFAVSSPHPSKRTTGTESSMPSITERSFLEIDLVTKYRHLKAGLQNKQVNKKIRLGGGAVANHFDLDFACIRLTEWAFLETGLHGTQSHPCNPWEMPFQRGSEKVGEECGELQVFEKIFVGRSLTVTPPLYFRTQGGTLVGVWLRREKKYAG